jgi:hypothetical protein
MGKRPGENFSRRRERRLREFRGVDGAIRLHLIQINRGNLYALSQILGHSNPAMTLKRYTRCSLEFMNDQRRTVDKTYSNGHQMDTRTASAV